MKVSEIFEGENSSLAKTFREACLNDEDKYCEKCEGEDLLDNKKG